jgi:signal transduction histidine kinase
MCQLDTDKTNQAQYLKLINSSIEKLFLFISQTLSHSKNLNMPIQKAKVYFESLIKEVFDSYQQSSGWSEINLSLRVSDDEYYGDPERIKVIFNSLISNSVKFFDPQKAEKRVEIEVSHEDAFIKIVFEDNGIGIPESVLPKIFDMFYRGNESSTGSGLGLYILKQYVDKMKGSVHVKSNLSEGSRFEIMIPKLARE